MGIENAQSAVVVDLSPQVWISVPAGLLFSNEAETIADNHESVRMLERLGFQREGTRRSYSWEDDGTFHAGAIYGLLRDEFNDTTTYQQELIPLHE